MAATPHKGLLIALEGIDGAGTTTQAERVSAWLSRHGIAVLRTAEPSKGPIGKYIRNILSKGIARYAPTTPEELALLFAADRLDHIKNEIEPAVKKGTWVVTDRYRLSSIAYQGIECDPEWVVSINKHAPPADLTVLIDLPVKAAMKRLKSRGGERERFESARLLEKIRDSYLKCAKRKREGRVIIIDGTLPINDVTLNILELIRRIK